MAEKGKNTVAYSTFQPKFPPTSRVRLPLPAQIIVLSHQIPYSDSAVSAWDPKQVGPLLYQGPPVLVSSPKKRGRGDGAAHLWRRLSSTAVLEAAVRTRGRRRWPGVHSPPPARPAHCHL